MSDPMMTARDRVYAAWWDSLSPDEQALERSLIAKHHEPTVGMAPSVGVVHPEIGASAWRLLEAIDELGYDAYDAPRHAGFEDWVSAILAIQRESTP